MVTSETLTIKEVERLNRNIDNLKKVASFLNAEILFENLKNVQLSDRKLANKLNLQYIRPFYSKAYGSKLLSIRQRNNAFLGYRNSLLFSAQEDFDSFMLYMEFDRPFEQRFWIHRRDKLMAVCKELQNLADNELDILFIELPPRVGKSTIGLWFTAWIGGKNAELSNLLVGHSSNLVKTFYTETENFITDCKYKFYEVFPTLKDTIETQAKELNINLGAHKRFSTFAFKSIDGSMSGTVEATNLLYVDDIVSGLEEALSPDRLEMKWNKLNTDVMQRRANSNVKILCIGTPWARNDPFEKLHDLYENDPLYRVGRVQIPATDESGHSNFNYNEALNIGFTDEFYRKQKETMDDISYQALYLLQRLDREGLLFSIDQFARFDSDKLRDKPKAIHTFCDVAWGGGDNLAMPFIYEYDDGYYLADVVFNKSNKDITKPIVVARIEQHKCYQAFFESNNGGDEYADNVKKDLQKNGVGCRIISKRSDNGNNAKLQRILKFSPEIQNLHILETNQQSQEYKDFMRNIITFNQNGKNKNDDAPDSLGLLFNELIKPQQSKVTICRRIF
ncbi:MAG: phage terminase large subunit [Clostridia bacterium]